ncbi:hypothetical protein J4G37_38395, partial [Microvirga sp. 3-52]|nr:hypothetical protein [Microvirga sp. 3-52]
QGFKQEAYSTWYPHLQLCLCYWEIGDAKLSEEHNNKAKKYRPNDPKVKYNEDFFEKYKENKNE